MEERVRYQSACTTMILYSKKEYMKKMMIMHQLSELSDEVGGETLWMSG